MGIKQKPCTLFGETINYFGETFAAILIWVFLDIIPITVAMTNELTTLFTLVLLYHYKQQDYVL